MYRTEMGQLDTLIQFLDPSASEEARQITEKIAGVYRQYSACAAAQAGPLVSLNQTDNEEVIRLIGTLRRLLSDLGQQYRLAEILGELSEDAFGTRKRVRLNFRYAMAPESTPAAPPLQVTHLRWEK